MSRRSLLSFAMLVGLGCAAPVATELPVSAAKVTLLDAGRAPRSLLRLQARPGDKTSSELTLEVETSRDSGNGEYSTPTSAVAHLWFETEVVDATPGNDIRIEGFIRRVSAASEDAQASRRSLEGLGWFAVSDHRGFIKKRGVIIPAATAPEQQQLLDRIDQLVTTNDWLLPEERVGIGAQWQVEDDVDLHGMRGRQLCTYTLTGIDGSMLSLAVTLSQTAPAQLVGSSDEPAEGAGLFSAETEGSGSLQLALDRIGFSMGTLAFTTTVRVPIPDGDVQKELRMRTSVKLGIESH